MRESQYDYRHIRLKTRPLTVSKKTYTITKSTLHFHDAHEILIIEQGQYKIYSPQLVYEGEGPCIVFFRLGTYHGAVRSNCETLPYVFHVMNFRQRVLDGMPGHPICTDKCLDASTIVIPIDNDTLQLFLPMLDRLEALSDYTYETPMPPLMNGYFAAILNYIYELIMENKSISFNGEGDEENYISKVIKVTLEAINRGENVTISGLAEQFHVSGTKLSRDFSKITGISIKQMIDTLRLERIKRLLRDGKSNIEVSELCGFSNSDYLIQFFNKHMNMSPGEYRRQKAQKPVN
ncbi:MAG: helix-turn-helix transcriptional regulator [Clostridia bacterium]|nr:helix-turn-helix transcriptional regulator [Clostridia bacterium]